MQALLHRSFTAVIIAVCVSALSSSGCASRRNLAAGAKVGMTPAEVEQVMRGSGRERSIVKEGEETIVSYDRTGDYFVFVDGRLTRHYRHGEQQQR